MSAELNFNHQSFKSRCCIARDCNVGLRLTLHFFALATLLAATQVSFAGDIEVASASARVVNDMYAVDAEVMFEFSQDAHEAMRSGVALFIDLDIRIKRKRKFLWDPRVLNLSRRYQLERHALTDRYVIVDLVTEDRRIYDSLEAAVQDLGRFRDVPIVEASELDASDEYKIALRASLDLESLPAPLRPIAYISPSWRMSSGWYVWTLTP